MDHPQSEKIDYDNEWNISDDELKEGIAFAQRIGLAVALKPTVNCKNGVWRAFVNFFDEDVPCEPKWSNWFSAYEAFQLHYARIAEEMGVQMHIAGCEMVMADRRDAQWRTLIKCIKEIYSGQVSYNCDKYQEHRTPWWDCVDVISSSGYYPLGAWDQELTRIENVVRHFNKPFFFAETGCMSRRGASNIPNAWSMEGEYSEEEQAEWYADMLNHCKGKVWLNGYVFWDWRSLPGVNTGYGAKGKLAEKVIRKAFMEDTQ
jgi:hypothetical protein